MLMAGMAILAGLAAGNDLPAWRTQVYGPERHIADADTGWVPECSGIVASTRRPDVYWVHNDSGNSSRLYAYRLNPDDLQHQRAWYLGAVDPAGVPDGDWEDIAATPDHHLYIFDGGDNPPCDRSPKYIHQLLEPVIPGTKETWTTPASVRTVAWEYPDPQHPSRAALSEEQRYDAECLLVHPATHDAYIVTKRDHRDLPVSRVFRIPASAFAAEGRRTVVAEPVAAITSPMVNMITAGDVDRRGERVVLRSYLAAFEFTLPAGRPFAEIFQQSPRMIPLTAEVPRVAQGEGICYTADGGDLLTTAETRDKSRKFPLFMVPWELANLRIDGIRPTAVRVGWQSRSACTGSLKVVPVGGASQVMQESQPSREHEFTVESLSAGTRYHYQIHCGNHSYPTTLPADETAFTTPAGPAP